MVKRSLQAVSVGVWVGALAGLATALADFGAHWLFMESTRDRADLLLRLLSTQVPVAAVLGALVALVHSGASPLVAARLEAPSARTRARAGIFALLLTPAIATVARLLFNGGKMSRLAAKPLLVPAVFVLLAAAAFGGLLALQVIFARARTAANTPARIVVAAVLAVAFAAAKLDQLVLPGLYDYLHAVLGVVALVLFALAAAIAIARVHDAGALPRRSFAVGLALALALPLGLQRSLASLDQNQNVRVALLSANVPHSRSLMLGLAPLLPRVDERSAELARQRAEQARSRRTRDGDKATLPTLEGAHVLLITIDALRADHLGLYGYTRHITPELDALGARGVVFEHAYAQAPHSSYSLCSLMTSEYLHETLDLGQPTPTATLPRVLAAAGYHTAAFYTQGIFHTAAEKLSVYENDAFGFALHEHQDRPAEEMTDRVLAEVDRTLGRGEPSALIWAHYFDVHEPYEATTLGTSDLDRYDSELLATDKAIGRLVRETERRFKKNLVIVITADHGEEFHDHGGVYHGSSVYEEQVHVPLLVIAKPFAPRRVAAPVESIDIVPTVLGLLDVDPAKTMRGADLRGLALGKQGSSSDRGPVFSAVIHKKMVVSWPYKLVADLRFGLFELYDLVHDPKERNNLADLDPQRVQALRGEVYAWIDSLAPERAKAQLTPNLQALEWGRLGDRRAVAPLSQLMLDASAPTDARTEAAALLGKLADPVATPALLTASQSFDPWVAAEAAIALGRLFDERAAPMLRKLVSAEDPGLRSRAAVSLGRLRDVAAVPSLIDALWFAPSSYEREEAVRWLGRLHDTRALEALINLLPEAHTRHLVVVAMGELGDTRAFQPLAQVLEGDRNANVRDGVVRGLGMLGDTRALSLIVPLLAEDPSLRNVGESLVRLHAIDRHVIGGTDLGGSYAGTLGFGECHAGPIHHDWDFLHRTFCTTQADQAALKLTVPADVSNAVYGNVAVLSIKRADSALPAELAVTIAGKSLEPIHVDGEWSEFRWPLEPGSLARGSVRAEIHANDPAARFEIDHLLLVPRSTSAVTAHGG